RSADSKEPPNTNGMIEQMSAKGLWTSPAARRRTPRAISGHAVGDQRQGATVGETARGWVAPDDSLVQQHKCRLAVVDLDVPRLPRNRAQRHLIEGEDALVALVERVIADSHSVDRESDAFRATRDSYDLALCGLRQ